MAESESMSLDALRAIVERAGLSLSDEELQSLKPLYERYVGEAARLHELEIDAEDLAVVFSPKWDPAV